MINVRGLQKSWGPVPGAAQLFKDVSLEVRKGEAIVLIGPSGSGKSTFLRCINGLETFQGGEIVVAGTVLHPMRKKRPSREEAEEIRKVRLKTGMVFQHFNLFPHLTVLENIILAPVEVLGVKKEEAISLARNLLERINLNGKEQSYPGRLSGGQQQRVAIARALAMRPDAMLFDEPTSALDPETVGEVLSVIRGLVDEGMTTLIATHEMGFAREAAHRVIVFDEGEIIESGPPQEIFTNPKKERTRNFLSRILRG